MDLTRLISLDNVRKINIKIEKLLNYHINLEYVSYMRLCENR